MLLMLWLSYNPFLIDIMMLGMTGPLAPLYKILFIIPALPKLMIYLTRLQWFGPTLRHISSMTFPNLPLLLY